MNEPAPSSPSLFFSHSHEFTTPNTHGEQRTLFVVILTAVMMVAEIIAGAVSGSMALLADGWHMGTHVAALGIAFLAYRYARMHSLDQRFSFGTGKVGVLGGFASAVGLAVVALLMGGESILRFFLPSTIHFNQAIGVACIGLGVNLFSAVILQSGAPAAEGGHHHHHSHGHHHDHNMRAAYLHVLADALTSVLAIVALLSAKYLHLLWLDPLMGIVGACLIAAWSYGLLRDTSRILLDRSAEEETLAAMRHAIEVESDDQVSDLHVWQVAPDHYAAIVSVVAHEPRPAAHYRKAVKDCLPVSHLTIEIHQAAGM